MSLEKLANGEIDTVLKKNAPITTEEQALDRFKEVTKILDFYRPHDITENKDYPLSGLPMSVQANFLAIINVGPTAFLGMVSVATFAEGEAVAPYFLGGFVLSILYNVVCFGVNLNDGRSKNKFRNFLCNVFLTKKAKARVRENGLLIDEYLHSVELYKLLVEKVRMQLESEGVFELVNHSRQTKFIHLSPTGHGQYLSLQDWKAKNAKLSNIKNLQGEISRGLLSSP